MNKEVQSTALDEKQQDITAVFLLCKPLFWYEKLLMWNVKRNCDKILLKEDEA